MKYTSTPRILKKYLCLLVSILAITLFGTRSYAQTKNYATVTPSTGIASYNIGSDNPNSNPGNVASVDNPENAILQPPGAPATLNARYVSLLGLGYEGEAYIQLKYGSPLIAGKTTYVRFDQPTSNGLNLDLLGIVGDLTGLFSKRIVQIDAYSGATAGSSGTIIPATNVSATVVTDVNGKTYFAVTSSVAYNSLRIRLRVRSNALSISLGSSINMNVYPAFNYDPDNCSSSIFTNVAATGLNVSLTSLVSNPQNAIDGNLNTFSQLQAGVVTLGSSVSQTIYLNGLSSATDVAKVVFSQGGSVLSVNVLKTITVQAFNGNTAVGNVNSLGNLINLDLLGLFTNNTQVPVFFTPGAPFDRIKVTLDNGLAIGGNLLAGGLNIHEAQRTVPKPLFDGVAGNAQILCGGGTLTLTPQSPDAGYTYNFYKKVGPNGPRTVATGVTANVLTEPGLAAGVYTYYVAAQKTGCVAESDLDSVVVTVKPTLLFTATPLSNGTVGKVYTKQINPATSGTGPYTYAITPGSALPLGLTMTSAGLISGTPTAAAAATTFSLIATDAGGCKATAVHTLTITGTLTLPTSILPNGIVNKVYPNTQLPTPTGGSTPYTYTATNLPPGVTLDPATGLFTGTPTTAGTYVILVTVTDADNNSVTTPYTIIVRSPLVLTASTLSDGTNGMPYTPQIIPSATGGSGVFTYSAVNLPAGLSFDPATRAITGTPTQSGTFTFPVTVTDNENNTTTLNYTLTVRDALALGNVVFPDGAVNVIYPTQTIPDATGGTGPYTYAGLNLPPGLTFDPLTKTVSGTPAQSGTFTLSIKVTDAANRTITVPYTLKVAGALILPTATLANGQVGAVYTSPSLPAVAGGTSPYTYTIAANQLPAGLSFDPSTRVISGTPTAGGNYTLTMKVTDNAGNTTSTDYALNITVDAPVVAGVTICSGNSATLTIDNLTNGVTYNFYSSTGNTPLGTGTTFSTPALTVTTTYFAEAVSGTAVSARIPVTVNVNPAPDAPAVLINSVTISSGQTATLQATATSGSTIKWYAAATGGIELASGGTFTTPPLTGNATYYAGTSNSFGCTSATRVPVAVSVINGTVNPNCYAATKQESGITGGLLCIACAILDPANSTDADLTNYTRISLPAGIGTTGYQRLIFQNPGAATDSIRLDLEIPSGLLDLSVLGGTTINVMNGTTVVSSYPLNSSLIHLSLLGGNRFKASVVAGGVYDRVEVKVNALLSALINVYIYGADVVAPNPTIVTGNQTICSGSTATLQVAPIAGTTIVWYSAATGGTILSTENIFTTPPLTATTIYYVQVSKNGCANETRLPVTVTVNTGLTPPVLATVVPVCAGLPATLSVDSPIAGITYKWYADATGGTALFTGTVFTTPALTIATTYYVEATNGSCVSATRTAANVTVNARPVTPQITTAMTTVAQGQRVSLTGTSTENNVTFNWYTDAAATTPVFTGATYLTPPLTATTTFYLDAISTVTGCASSTRVQQTITVVPTGTPIPVGCEGPISQTNGVGGLASILARVDNPELSVDGDQQTGSTLAIPIGIGSNVYQKAVFAGLSNVGDTVRVLLNSPGQLLSLSLVPSVTVTTYQGNTSNNDGVAINNPVINLQLLSGGTQALLTFVPAAQFDGVEVKLNSGLVGALTAINFNYAKRTAQAPVVASADVTACLNAPATLAVPAPQPGIIYKWYDAAGTYLGNDGATFTTPAITATTKFFVEASRGGCGSSRTQVNVTVSPAPLTPLLLAPSQSTCAGSSIQIKVQSPQAGVTYNWYKAGVLVPGQTTSIFTDVVTADVTYEVEAVNNCGTTSAKAAVAVTVGILTPPVLTPAAVTINSGEKAVLIANSSTTGLTYHWYGADPAVVPGTPELSTLANGANGMFATDPLTATTTFYVTAEGAAGTCISAAASVVVTVNTITPNPGSVPCEGATVAQATEVNGPALFAGVANPAFAADDDATTSSSLFIPVGLGNSYVSQRVGFVGLSTPGDQVKLSLTQTGALLTLGIANSITVTTYKNGISNNDEKNITDPQLNLNIISGNKDATITFTPGTTFDAVELKLKSGLAGLLTSVNLNYAQRIIAPPTVVATAVSACEGSAATLAVSNPVTGVTYTWYDSSGAVASNDATFSTPTTLTAGTYTYTVNATRGTCAGLVSTTVTVIITGAAPAAVPATGNPATTCLNTPVTLRVDPVTGVTYNWYDALTAGNLIASNTNSFITPTSLPAGTTTYYVEASNGNSCGNALARTPIAITINPDAIAADITVSGAENSVCVGTGAVLTATSTLTNPVFTWYKDAALSDAVFTGATFNVPSVTATTNYYVTVKADTKCANAAGMAKVVTLTVNPPATAADITVTGIPVSTCAGDPVTLTASSATVSNPLFIWYKDAALTIMAQTGATFVATASATTTLYYVTVQGTNKCKNAAADAKVVTLVVNPPATASDINVNGVPAILCSGSGTILTASSLTVVNPVFTWHTDAALMNPVFTGDVFNVPALTTSKTYYVTVQGLNKCPNLGGQALAITLNVNAPLNFAGKALNDGSTINPYSVQIDPANGGTAPYTYALASSSALPAGLTLSSAGLISGTPTTAGNYTFTINASDSKGCSTAGVFTLNIGTTAVLSLPAATLPDGQVGTAYPVQTLPAAIGGTTPYTYVVTGLPAGLSFDPATRNITGTPTIGGMFTVTMTVTDGSNRNASANYSLNVIVPAPIVADGSNCGGSRVTLVVTNAVPAITYNWFADATARIPIFTGTSFQTPAITVNTIYYVEGLAGITSTRVAVNVNLKSPASSADITITGIPSVVCGGSGASLTASSATVSNPVFTWYTDVALTTAVFTGAVYNTPVLTTNTTYYVTVQGPNTCESSSATAKTVVLTVNPALMFNGATLAGASTSTTYSAQIGSATGGTPGYTYSLQPGSTLPAGLSLSSAGLLTGTPTTAGNYAFAVTATDSKGCTAVAAFVLGVGSSTQMTLPPATLPDGQVGSSYTPQTLPGVVGGTAPYTYVATGLPPGLNFDPVTRVISGTPTLGGSFPVLVTVTDGNGLTATNTYTINVTVPASAVGDAISCGGSPVTLTVTNVLTGVTYNWYNTPTGGSVLFTGPAFLTPAITATTIFYVEAISGTASSGRIAVNVTVAAALASPVVTVKSSTLSSITFGWNDVPGATSYEVSMDGGTTWTSPSSGAAGTAHLISGLPANTTIKLMVRAKGNTTCQTSTAGSVTGTVIDRIVPNDIFIPNTFTPNGDGKNDIFYVHGNAIAKMRMCVYNQWGQFIFESLQQQVGWDGSYRGQMQPNGVYVYYVEVTLTDGSTAMRKGTITILR